MAPSSLLVDGLLHLTFPKVALHKSGAHLPLSFNMPCSLSGQAAALLQSGQVLLTSGGGCASSDEIFDPNRGQVFIGPNTIIPHNSSREPPPTATLLPDGRILIIGGVDVNNPSPIAETYVPPRS